MYQNLIYLRGTAKSHRPTTFGFSDFFMAIQFLVYIYEIYEKY